MAYASDLLDYMERLGDAKPDTVLADPEFTKRALSEQSPVGLVAIVAREVPREALDDLIADLSTFERARIFSVLGETAKADAMYKKVLAESNDTGIRGKTLANMGILHSGEPNSQIFFRRAIEEEGYYKAYGQWASVMSIQGAVQEALRLAYMGLSYGDNNSLSILLVHLDDLEDPQPEARAPQNVSTLEKIQRNIREMMGWKKNDDPQAIRRRKLAELARLASAQGMDFEKVDREFYASQIVANADNPKNRLSSFMKMYRSTTAQQKEDFFGESPIDGTFAD